MAKTRILLVDDDPNISQLVNLYLTKEGFDVTACMTGTEALRSFKSSPPNLMLLDVMLPGMDGWSVLREIRKFSNIPIIMITAKDETFDKVLGLELGADDYIAKPFRPRELVSRMKNALRRRGGTRSVVQLENVSVDTDKGVITKNGQEIALSALEYKILLVFIGNRGRMLSRTRLLEEIWDIAGDYVNDNTLTVYIKRIREKIEDDPANPKIIKTIRGLGYRVD